VTRLIEAHERGARVPLATRRSDVPPRLARIVERALAHDPGARFASASELRDALGRMLGQRPRVHPAQVGLTMLALAAVAVLTLALRHQFEMLDANKVALPPAPTLAMSTRPWWTSPPDTILSGLGWFVSGADFDGDGRADVLVSDAAWSRDVPKQGRAVVFAGGRDGLGRAPAWTFMGRRTSDQIGGSVSRAGDVNGDGIEDALVRDPGNLMGGPVATGGVLLFLGSRHGLAREPVSVLVSDTPGSGFGSRIAAAGDVSHDRFGDVLVSTNGTASNQGRALLYLGGPHGLGARPARALVGAPSAARSAGRHRRQGHLHDGYDDVMVGSGSGRTAAARWARSNLGARQPAPCTGLADRGATGTAMALAGRSVAGIGDVNGDGFGDAGDRRAGPARGCGESACASAAATAWARRGASRVRQRLRQDSRWRRRATSGDAPTSQSRGTASRRITPPSQGAVFLYRGVGPRRLFRRSPSWWATETQPEAVRGLRRSRGRGRRRAHGRDRRPPLAEQLDRQRTGLRVPWGRRSPRVSQPLGANAAHGFTSSEHDRAPLPALPCKRTK
jgi:hypothetical protein